MAASFDVTPAIGDDLTCVFTNTPLVADLEIVRPSLEDIYLDIIGAVHAPEADLPIEGARS